MNFLKKTATAVTLATTVFAGAAAGVPDNDAGFVPVGNQQGECAAQYSRAVKQLAPAIVNTPVNAWNAQQLDKAVAALSPEEQCSLKKNVGRMLDSEADSALRALNKAVGLAQGNEQVRSHIERDVKDPECLRIIFDYAKKLSDIRTQMGIDRLRPENYFAEKRAAEDAIKAVVAKKREAVLNALNNPGNAPVPQKPVYSGPVRTV